MIPDNAPPSRLFPVMKRVRTLCLAGALGLATTTAVAGPSLPHLGSHPQGLPGRVTPEPREDTEHPNSAEAGSIEPACPASDRHYRKSLLVTAFPRREQTSSNAGRLHDAEHQLPALLGEQLAAAGQLASLQRIPQGLASATEKPARRAQQVRQLARRAEAQLVLTGELIELAMADARTALAPGVLTRGRNTLASGLNLNPDWDTRQRDFVLEISLLDGVTGEPVFQRQFHTRGVWNPKRAERMRFGSPAFWKTDYGVNVRALLQTVGAELNDAVRCEPLVGRLEASRPGQPLILHAGAEQGLYPGDRLPLYQVVQRSVPGEYRHYTAHLMEREADLTVLEAYRNYSLVQLEGSSSLRGTHVALTPGSQPPDASRRQHGDAL